MKELSIKEKAKRYDEAIERARKINSGDGVPAPPDWTTCEVIFPELRESEDERIRKGLIQYFKNFTLNTFAGLNPKKILAWLEKQDGQKPILDFKAKNWYVSKVDGKIHNICYSSNNIEPKFKVGDWVVSPNGVYWHIDAIRNGRYEVTANTGQCGNWQLNTNIYRLWSIQDAKDGDVLVCLKYAGDIIPNIFIYSDTKIKDNDVFCYCSFLDTFRTESYVASADPIDTDFYPATKEQRDLLFQKMKEAGYEWSVEKKELKKIEQSPIDVRITGYWHVEDVEQKPAWSEEDEKIYQSIMDDTVQENQLNSKQTNWLRDIKYRYFPQPKPAEWSEKDEQKIGDIHDAITLDDELEESYKEELYNFLKFLKDRIQLKQEWSEDTQQWIDAIIFDYEFWYDADKDHRTTIQAKINILKSLKDRYTWKPSDEQIEILDMVLSNESMDDNIARILRELREQLKKLREE